VSGTINAISICLYKATLAPEKFVRGIKFHVDGGADIVAGKFIVADCTEVKGPTKLVGPLYGFRTAGGAVLDYFYPYVDTCTEKYVTVEFEIPEPDVVFQFGESHEQTLLTRVEMLPAWSHLPLPLPAVDVMFSNDDLAQLDVASLKFTASTSDPTKVGIDYANSPNKVQIHIRQISAFIEGFEATTTVTRPVEIQVLPTC